MNIKAAPFETTYGRKCRSPAYWTKIGDSQLTGPKSRGYGHVESLAIEGRDAFREMRKAEPRRGPEFTSEREDQFRNKYLHLFLDTAPLDTTNGISG
ncbi:hypothetical protein Tco_0581350 [Tanacetum coccineum]